MAGVFARRAPQRTALVTSPGLWQLHRDLRQGTGRSTRPARATTPAILLGVMCGPEVRLHW
jgi:hypothetical protein